MGASDAGFASDCGVWTYGDRTILWFIKGGALQIMVENKEIAYGFRKQFDFL